MLLRFLPFGPTGGPGWAGRAAEGVRRCGKDHPPRMTGALCVPRNLGAKQMAVAGRHLLDCLSIFARFYYFAVPGFRIN